MPASLWDYAEWLDQRGLRWPVVPPEEPVKASAYLKPLSDIRVVLWNVYGTLVRITDGELLIQHSDPLRMEIALDKTLQEFNMWNSMTRKPGAPWQYLQQIYSAALERIKLGHGVRKGDTPAINSAEIWLKVIGTLNQKGYPYDKKFYGDEQALSEKIAYFFHSCLQGIGPVPGAFEALSAVAQSGRIQGILADAQPFTWVQLLRTLKQGDEYPDWNRLFKQPAVIFSYLEHVRKPSPTLYYQAVDRLAGLGIEPHQILYVTTRIADDLCHAKALGVRTALLVREKLGLSVDPADLRDPKRKPDRMLTELTQIRDILPV